ncbi:hypothetical protein DBV08_00370 [Rhodococcus sp. KBW08]|nr:hypothetical protein DBV08_00370 [Rhodococcus sp. KBW08]
MAITGMASAAVVIGGIAMAAPANAAPCGYSQGGNTGIYNHCANNHIRIEIDYNIGGNESRCVGPGETILMPRWVGTSWPVYAWYTGGC